LKVSAKTNKNTKKQKKNNLSVCFDIKNQFEKKQSTIGAFYACFLNV